MTQPTPAELERVYSLRARGLNAEAIAARFQKPIIATADVHILKKLNTDYAIIEAVDLTAESVLQAIRYGKFKNVTAPQSLFDLYKYYVNFLAKYIVKYVTVKIFGSRAKKLELETVLETVEEKI